MMTMTVGRNDGPAHFDSFDQQQQFEATSVYRARLNGYNDQYFRMIRHKGKILDFFKCILVWLLLVIPCLPGLFLFFLYKKGVILLAQWRDKHLHPPKPNDTYFFMGDTNDYPIVNVAQIWRVDGYLEVAEFKGLFQRLFISCPESRRNYLNFYCYLESFGGYVFKKSVDTVDLDRHIRVRTLEGLSLEQFIAKWMLQERFPEKRPLWEIVLVYLPGDATGDDKLEGEKVGVTGETVALLKMHHCLTDGYGSIHIVGKLTGNEAPYLVKEEEESFWEKITGVFFGPKYMVEEVVKMARTRDIFYPLKDRQNANWYVSMSTVNLEKLKRIRRRTNTHFISVLMSVTIGAVRRYLIDSGKQGPKTDPIPRHIWSGNSLPWPNHPRTTLTNHWTAAMFKIPFKTEDALERLYGTEGSFKYCYDNQMHKTLHRFMMPGVWCLPSALLRWGNSKDLFYLRNSNVFASLLLSEAPHYLMGKRVKQLYLPLGVKDVISTCVMFGVTSSHSGQVDFSIVGSSELVPDQDSLDKISKVYFDQELEELCRNVEEREATRLELEETLLCSVSNNS